MQLRRDDDATATRKRTRMKRGSIVWLVVMAKKKRGKAHGQ